MPPKKQKSASKFSQTVANNIAIPDARYLSLYGARENTLKGINLTLPHDRLIAVTGVSGSGKSTLAFDTIYAEGARRYIETFSPYTRQFLDKLHQPDLDRIEGARPALALEQRNRTVSARSTVGTVTEINDYLKIIWASLATFYCPKCDVPVRHDSARQIANELIERALIERWRGLLVAFPILRGESSAQSLASTLLSEGFVRFTVSDSNDVFRIEELPELEDRGATLTELLVIVDRLATSDFALADGGQDLARRSRIVQTLSQAYHFGHGELVVIPMEDSHASEKQHLRYYDSLSCQMCGAEYRSLRPSAFSFNSPLGACAECSGFGRVLEIDPRKVVPDEGKSILQHAVSPWSTPARSKEYSQLKAFCRMAGIPLDRPWRELEESQRKKVFWGEAKSGHGGFHEPEEVRGKVEKRKVFPGVLAWFEKLKRKRRHLHVRVFLSKYRSEILCPTCNGGRLRDEALSYRLDQKTLRDIWFMPVSELVIFFDSLLESVVGLESLEVAMRECISRLRYLETVGLSYLTLDRQSRTLSGGEFQRVNLTSLLGSNLVQTTLVLDEPTIALHPRDTQRLIGTLITLRDRGNTVVVVEHEPEVIRIADHICDLGPGSGAAGGECVYQGDFDGLLTAKNSLTGKYLSGEKAVTRKTRNFKREAVLNGRHPSIEIKGASAHNLKDIDVSIPLGGLVVITGVSGSGKSSLVEESFFKTWENGRSLITNGRLRVVEGGFVKELTGLDAISEVVMIDQSPVGKTPRSNAGTYTKAWDHIRDILAATPDAERYGLGKSAFSFNVTGGRCPECEGAGYQRIEMQFLADVFVECENCGGKRFKEEVLSVRFNGKNVDDLLQMSVDECVDFLKSASSETSARSVEKAISLLQPMISLGMGYLRIGQPLNEISGGEAQRLKLSSYFSVDSSKRRGEKPSLFLLDEPTTGLHPENIQSLLDTLNTFIQQGHTVVCVEHNTDMIRNADWVIDLGPEGGEAGGQLIVQGVPQELLADPRAVSDSETLRCLKDELSAAPDPLNSEHSGRQVSRKRDSLPRSSSGILIQGARENNLKNITVEFERDQMTVVTGVSGSGKSTLAFDILFQEGQRRYIDCLSPFARQYLTQVKRADVDRIDSIPPTIAVSQKTAPPVGVSTLATVTEIYQFLRLLYAKAGEQLCPDHGVPITGLGASDLTGAICDRAGSERISIFAPVVDGRKGFYTDLFERALRAEIDEARVDGKMLRIEPGMRLERQKLHTISLLVGQIGQPSRSKTMVEAAVKQALLLGSGTIEVVIGAKDGTPLVFSTERMCPVCRRGFRELDPRDFSFRSDRGMCETCNGWGWLGEDELDRETCPDCEGARIGEVGRNVILGGWKIFELVQKNSHKLLKTLETIELPARLAPIVDPIMREILHRLAVIDRVGLGYLSLDRDASSISGGEAQRLRLARTLGSPLSGVCYVFDEPTIGLHPSDHDLLMDILKDIRDRGNTVVIVEHDEETILQADRVIDIGPSGGRGGGELVVSGTVVELLESERSVTGRALSNRLSANRIASKTIAPSRSATLKLTGASRNNLKNITAEFPIGALSVVCGVSGSGKSSLVHGSLIPAIVEMLTEEPVDASMRFWKRLTGGFTLERMLEIDQAPVGRTSASTPASYLGIFEEVRKIYALLPEARARGWGASHFSFNSGKGRCPACQGKGVNKIPMSFLPEATLVCEECEGMRYTDSTLEVLFQGISIGDLLKRTMSESIEIFSNHPKVKRLLTYVEDLGIGYLTLGQPTHTLSGGEVQRLKIARELGARESVNTLYVLDEPTIGLHMTDVDRLMAVLRRLIEKGNTIVVIEHNLDVIAASDHVIEVGPGAGDLGGEILYSGPPSGFAEIQGAIKPQLMTPTAIAYRTREERFQQLLSGQLGNQTNRSIKRALVERGNAVFRTPVQDPQSESQLLLDRENAPR